MGINIKVIGRMEHQNKTWQASLVGGTETARSIGPRALWSLLILTQALREELPSSFITTALQGACDSRALAFRGDLFEWWKEENTASLKKMKGEGTNLVGLLNRGFASVLNTYYPHSDTGAVRDHWTDKRLQMQTVGDFELTSSFYVTEDSLLDRFASFNRENRWRQEYRERRCFEWRDEGYFRDPIGCSEDSDFFAEIISRRVVAATGSERTVAPFHIAEGPLSFEETAFLEGLPVNIFEPTLFERTTYPDTECPSYAFESVEKMLAAAGLRLPRIDEILHVIKGTITPGKRIPVFKGAPPLGLGATFATNTPESPFSYKYDYLQEEKDRLPEVAQKIDELTRQNTNPEGFLVAVGAVITGEKQGLAPPEKELETGLTVNPAGKERRAAAVQFIPVRLESERFVSDSHGGDKDFIPGVGRPLSEQWSDNLD